MRWYKNSIRFAEMQAEREKERERYAMAEHTRDTGRDTEVNDRLRFCQVEAKYFARRDAHDRKARFPGGTMRTGEDTLADRGKRIYDYVLILFPVPMLILLSGPLFAIRY